MENEKIKKIAIEIVSLEKECQKGKIEKMNDLDKIISKLSIEDMLLVDEYIYQKNLLT